MKKNFKRWMGFLLAVVVVAATCIYSSDAFLRANEEEVLIQESPEVQQEQAITVQAEDETDEDFEEEEVTSEEEISGEDGEETTEEEISGEDGEETTEEEASDETDVEEAANETDSEETVTEESKEEVSEKEEIKETEKKEVERSIKVTSSLGNEGVVEEGVQLVLTAHLTGFDDVDYEIQWQQSEDGENWNDIYGENGMKYTVILTEDNEGYLWRASVSTSES